MKYARVFNFLNDIYKSNDFRLKRECRDAFTMMRRYHKNRKPITDLMWLDLVDMMRRAEKPFSHPEWARSEATLCGILEDIQRCFAR